MNDPTAEQLGALATAVCAVMSEVTAVKKTGHNQHGRYSYASDADLMYALQPAMSKHGLALMPCGQEVTTHEDGQSKMRWRVLTVTTWRLIHTGGGWTTLQTIGEGADSGDKSGYKAMTGALKYALRQLFMVPTGDDPENDGRNKAPEPSKADAPATWTPKERAAFCAKLGDMGIKYEEVKAYCLAHDKDKPSSGSPRYRGNLIKALSNVPGDPDENGPTWNHSPARVKLDSWLANQLTDGVTY